MEDEWRIVEFRPGGPVSHELVFAEEVTAFREDLVAEAVEFLVTLPGVAAVERIEREAIAVVADAVPTRQLTEAVRRWWETANQQLRPWMVAMDRAAQTAFDLAYMYGYQRHGWELIRVLDAELAHVMTLDHQFGDEPSEHFVIITACVRLTLPDVAHFTVVWDSKPLDDDVALVSAITGRVLPTLEALSAVDAILERWQGKRGED